MPPLIAVLPSLTRCASLLSGELGRIPVGSRRTTQAATDADGVNFWTTGANDQLVFAFQVAPADLLKHLPALALALDLNV